ncbi:MAG: hypothetical protein L6Q99_16355 [Planctomycetes bacterium]|nr:hypothetical protein [Planctomycetota bacterium]
MRLPRRSPFLCAVVGALLASAAGAQNERSLARDDLAYARALAQSGLTDLASDFLAVYEAKHRTNRDEMLAIDALRLDLREEQAYREPDLRKRLALLDAVVTEKEGFVADHGNLPLAEELVVRLPDLYRVVGELTAAVLEAEPGAKDAKELKAKSRKRFERALLDLHERVAALGERRSALELDAADPELDRRYMLATYNLARTHYYHALVLDPRSDEQRENVDQALALLLDFQLDFGDQLLCYEGFIYEGLCHLLIGEGEKAFESFDSAIRLRESYEKGANGVYSLPPEACDLVSNAVYQKLLAQNGKGDRQGVIATAEDFLATVPEPLRAYRGVAILGAAADAYRENGDTARVEAAAKRLIEADPRGPGGERGRTLLREGGSTQIVASDSFKLAEAAASRGETDKAIELAQEAARLARGSKNEQDAGAQAGVLIGALQAQKGSLVDAAATWETAAETYPQGKDAPECLWRAINAYLSLAGKEKSKAHREKARAGMQKLAERYPSHPYASQAAFIEGQELEQERKYADAAAVYERIAKEGGAGREEALYRAGQAWSRAAREAFVGRKKQDGAGLAAKAEQLLVDAYPALEKAAAATLDRTTQDRLHSIGFSARVALANLYMLEGVGRAADALPLFADSETRFAKDASKLATARRVRMKALQLAGRIDDAVAILDQCKRTDPTLAGMGSAAASLAQAIDANAAKLERDDPLSSEVERQRRRAAEHYDLALQAASSGPDDPNALGVAEVALIADRLFALALQFNAVPNDAETFLDGSARRPAPDAFEQALRAYEELARLEPSAKTEILIGRTLGFLGRFPDAAARYAALFAKEPFVDLEKREISIDKARTRPELLSAALEWAAAERQTGAPKSDAERLGRASALLEAIVLVAKPASRTWWHAKQYQVRVLLDRGEYEVAAIALRSIQRSYPEYDEAEFGVRDKFLALDEELKRLGHK